MIFRTATLLSLLFVSPFLNAFEHANFERNPLEIETKLRDEPFTVLEAKRTENGIAGARKVKIKFEDGTEMKIKWKTAPSDGNGWNNSPRKEIGAYEIQKLFLDPEDFVVPPTTVRCLTREEYRKVNPEDRDVKALAGTRCVYGAITYWLQNVEVPETVLSERRFRRDSSYAYFISNLNVLGYIVEHRDGRRGNILVSTDPSRPQFFAVDNGISFGTMLFPFFRKQWEQLRVPKISAKTIERLSRVKYSDVENLLSVVVEMRRDENRILQHVPKTRKRDADMATQVRHGYIQDGFSDDRISEVYEKIRELVQKACSKEIATF